MQEVLSKAEQALQAHLVDSKQVEVDAALSRAAAEMLNALSDVPRAAVRFGSLLILKFAYKGEGNVVVRMLSRTEMLAVDEFPEILTAPVPCHQRRVGHRRRSQNQLQAAPAGRRGLAEFLGGAVPAGRTAAAVPAAWGSRDRRRL